MVTSAKTGNEQVLPVHKFYPKGNEVAFPVETNAQPLDNARPRVNFISTNARPPGTEMLQMPGGVPGGGWAMLELTDA